MNTPADHPKPGGHSISVAPVQETRYLARPEGRIGYDIAGEGPLVILVPGMGDLRAGYRWRRGSPDRGTRRPGSAGR